MKATIIATAAALAFALPAFAQSTPSANPTAAGTATTPGNGAGAPSAATPAGQVGTAGTGVASPAGVPALGGPAPAQQTRPTADSSTTGTTTK